MAKVKKRKNTQVKNIATFKYKKFHHKSLALRANYCSYYPSAGPAREIFGLQFTEAGFLHFAQWKSLIDTVRKAIKGKARMRLHLFCDMVARKKKTGIRMGKGKGTEVL
jgi:ribosomal protein L16/L10AE